MTTEGDVSFHCWVHAGTELDIDADDKEDAEMSLKNQLVSLVGRVLMRKKTPVEVEECRPHRPRKWVYIIIQ